MAKYIFITGGVVSSIGKGIVAASLGCILKSRGFKVTIVKFDPYINVDAGTMNPYQHGEVYVTDDGAETDLDLGHYERFISESLNKNNNVTTGKIYASVIERERKGDYLGDTIRVIPHITDEIKECIKNVAVQSRCQIAIVEIGGTVGDIESLPFLEAIRQMGNELGEKNRIYIHITLIPHLKRANELKTKPTQHSVKELRSIGIQPDIIICRTEKGLTKDMISKIALHCDVSRQAVIENRDVSSIYEVPLLLEKKGLGEYIVEKFSLRDQGPHLKPWIDFVSRLKTPKSSVNIALVGKYIELKDAYLSVCEALVHAGVENEVELKIKKIDAEKLENGESSEILGDVDGILVPGGFGGRGTNGKVKAIEYSRINKIPFLGICYGMQCAVVEFARNVLGLKDANSTEINIETTHPVIDVLPEQKAIDKMGGTMRLGAYNCKILKDTKAFSAYNKHKVTERHRHRYEFNNEYRQKFEEKGMIFSGLNPERDLVEIIELVNHPWFVASQFHPEFKSSPNKAHPLFKDFIKAAKQNMAG